MRKRSFISILLLYSLWATAGALPAAARAGETVPEPAPSGHVRSVDAEFETALPSPHPWTEVGASRRGPRGPKLFPPPYKASPLAVSAPWSGRDSFQLDSAALAEAGSSEAASETSELDLSTLRLAGERVELPKPRSVTSDKSPPKLFGKKKIASSVTTFAEWTGSGRDNAFQAGLDVSLFSRSKLRVTHRVHPFRPARILEEGTVTEASLGVDLGSGGIFRLTGKRGDQETEVGTGLFFRPSSSLEVGAQARATRATPESGQSQPWNSPTLEGRLRLTW